MRAPLVITFILAPFLGACAESTTEPVVSPESHSETQPARSAEGSASGAVALVVAEGLRGGGSINEAKYDNVHGFSTSLLPSSRGMVEAGGRLAQVLGDTVLQILLVGTPEVGTRSIATPAVRLDNAAPVAVGSETAMMMIRNRSGDHIRYLIPIGPAELVVTQYIAPSVSIRGEIQGRIAFDAQEYVVERVYEQGFPVTRTRLGAATRVDARFVTPLLHQLFGNPRG